MSERRTDFGRGMVVGAKHMEHSISEIRIELNSPRSTVSRMCRKYLIAGISSYRGQRTRLLTDLVHRRLYRVVGVYRQAPLREIIEIINVGHVRHTLIISAAKFGFDGLCQQKAKRRSIPD